MLSDTREGHEHDMWTLSGESGNAWYQAEVPVSSLNPFRVSHLPVTLAFQGHEHEFKLQAFLFHRVMYLADSLFFNI